MNEDLKAEILRIKARESRYKKEASDKIADLESRLGKLIDQRNEITTKLVEAKAKISALETEYENNKTVQGSALSVANSKIEKLNAELKTTYEQCKSESANLQSTQNILAKTEKDLVAAQKHITTLSESLKSSQNELANMKKLLAAARTKEKGVETKIKILENTLEKHSGTLKTYEMIKKNITNYVNNQIIKIINDFEDFVESCIIQKRLCQDIEYYLNNQIGFYFCAGPKLKKKILDLKILFDSQNKLMQYTDGLLDFIEIITKNLDIIQQESKFNVSIYINILKIFSAMEQDISIITNQSDSLSIINREEITSILNKLICSYEEIIKIK